MRPGKQWQAQETQETLLGASMAPHGVFYSYCVVMGHCLVILGCRGGQLLRRDWGSAGAVCRGGLFIAKMSASVRVTGLGDMGQSWHGRHVALGKPKFSWRVGVWPGSPGRSRASQPEELCRALPCPAAPCCAARPCREGPSAPGPALLLAGKTLLGGWGDAPRLLPLPNRLMDTGKMPNPSVLVKWSNGDTPESV